MSAPLAVSASSVVHGAATKKGMPWCAQLIASAYVPILFAVSPLFATRSAPTTTASTAPLAISAAAALSTTSVAGVRPSATSSYAVSRAPWLYGRVSVQ